ncbi:oxygenase MpaB family protein [Nannocystis sp. RBIL2]|uniref:oxygenase MpaB family protein n=1 Tax=Nannocystis sp. RBIL2 TaxID=2996788 RepID=UPI00226E8076|nr:oxygenase MpaB family protein [Nannocystis sp. RBIL2]MCY1072584.1 oxygenase MpaB family protein [Nannocystis sp. RBIL2]
MSDLRWSDEQLDHLRTCGDAEADDVILDLFARGDDVVRAINMLMRDLVENNDVPATSLPPGARAYFLATGLPSWADPARIELGQRVFHRYGPLVILLLNTYSLPICYAAAKGAQVLVRTGRLQSNPQRRIVETAQLVVDVMAPGGLDPTSDRGAGLRSVQKVRLMHATIRHLLRRDPSWDPAFGLPINQEDMLGTLMSFSVATLEGLERLGVALAADEVDAYMHTWNVIGAVMGLRQELLPRDYAEGRALADRIGERHFAACPEGQALTRALLEMMEYLAPGTAFDGVPAEFVRWFTGDRVADILGVPAIPQRSPLIDLWRLFGRVGDRLGDRSETMQHAATLLSRAFVQGLLLANRGGQRLPFHIPTELRQVWGVNWP